MIIDTHVHTGGAAVGFDMTEEKVIAAMDKYGIDYSLVSNGDSGEMDHGQNLLPEETQMSQEDVLRDNIAMARRHSGRIGLLVWVRPYHQTATEELYELINENIDIIKGIKLHPFHSNVAPDSEKFSPFIELARKFNFPIVSHTGGCEAAEPIHMYNAAKANPDINFVMVHMVLGSDNSVALDLLGKLPNLYGDTAWVPMATTIEAYNRYGSKKMMFGSDMPIDGVDTYLCNPKGERSLYQDYFHVLNKRIPKEAYDDLMFCNAIKIFNLENL